MKKKQLFNRISFAKHLGEFYCNEQPEEASFEQLIYLTNPSRGEHVSQRTLRNNIRNCKAGNLLRKLDPTAFEVQYSEVNRSYNRRAV